MPLVTIIGRGHGGTRAMSHTLSASGVFMGEQINESGDMLPPDALYEACRVIGRRIRHLGGFRWDFDSLHTGPIDPAFTRLLERYLAPVFRNPALDKGWKLPETTLVYPWLVRLFPDIHYIHWIRDPRDSIHGGHLTDDLAAFGIPWKGDGSLLARRVASWKYQREIVRATPAPARQIAVRFEDFVLKQDETLAKLRDFLGRPLAKLPVRPGSVGRWRAAAAEERDATAVLAPDVLELGYPLS
ncbi:MAG: sulfotransferase family protein [Kiritimatiellia bacterium]|jgi:hypothetical protein